MRIRKTACEGLIAAAHRLRTCRFYMVWDPLGDLPELVRIHNPVAKLDHAKREIVAARFYEIPAEAVTAASTKGE